MADATPNDDIAALASDLRALRLAAGSPTLGKLQHDTGISKTVLSDAFAGRQLPSARTVDRVVRACGEDPARWVRRRDAIATGSAATLATATSGRVTSDAQASSAQRSSAQRSSADASSPGASSPGASATEADREPRAGSTARRPLRRGAIAALVAGAFVLGTLASAGVSAAVTAAALDQARAEAREAAIKELTDAPINPRAQINVHNGVDPALTPCVNDAEVATSSDRTNHTRLEIIWSNKCYAGWGRVTRYDEQVSGNSVTVSIYPETAPQGPDRQSATEPNVQGAYTTLVVRPTPQTRLCAVGAITVDGESIDLGEPLCI
ncbi:DUF2690 domain-containing protein [Agromyces intestinalis]|nr:DUF2690 domain-containing protein [Agromyces intestinalis]